MRAQNTREVNFFFFLSSCGKLQRLKVSIYKEQI